jgi:hypothetical protein
MTNRISIRRSIATAFAIVATSFNSGNLIVGVNSFQISPAAVVVGRRLYEYEPSSSSSWRPCNNNHYYHDIVAAKLRPNHIPNTRKSTTTILYSQLSATSSPNNNNEGDIDSLILRTSNVLRASSWFSWWSQVILTVISSITFLFARNVMTMPAAATTASGMMGGSTQGAAISKFFLPGLGIAASSLSIIWTWGQRRLARRFVRPRRVGGGGGNSSSTSKSSITSRIEAANLLRSTIKFGVTINLFGLLTSVLGAQYIIGTLVAKSMQSFVGLGGSAITSQTLQPLDVLVVQANTNVLSSHFVSLVCLLWLTRMVDLLDPPSLEDDI